MNTDRSLPRLARFFFGKSSWESLGDDEARKPHAETLEWCHLDRSHPDARHWLETEARLEANVVDALLAEETRPRFSIYSSGLLLNIRGINLNPGMQPDEMISLRVWFTDTRVVSLRKHRIASIDRMLGDAQTKWSTDSPEGLVSILAAYLSQDIADAVMNLNNELDDLESLTARKTDHAVRGRISELRRQTIVLRRYLAPQKEALSRFQTRLRADSSNHDRLVDAIDVTSRSIEDLDAIRDRSGVMQDELITQQSERLNRNMFAIAILTVFFLPLTFLTGLLGVNLSGIPFANNAYGFAALCILVFFVSIVEICILWRLGWMRNSKLS